MSSHRPLIVERDEAETYLLISLVSFAATIIGVRLFLQLTGYPQLGSSTLHIAHLLWGGLGLFVAVLVVLIYDNPQALRLAAVLSGVGIGLFIDEVGKFITQTNDYFFPAAAPIIYGFFLMTVLIFLIVRRPEASSPPRAMVQALEDLQDLLYSTFDTQDLAKLRQRLQIASQSTDVHIRQLAEELQDYVERADLPIADPTPGILTHTADRFTDWCRQQGQYRHRMLIVIALIVVAGGALTAIVGLTYAILSPNSNLQTFILQTLSPTGMTSINDVNLYLVRLFLEASVGFMAIIAIYYIVRGDERRGMLIAIIAAILSLTAIQLLTFYLDQFTAILPTLLQFAILAIIIAYRHWYLAGDSRTAGLPASAQGEPSS